MDREPAAGRAGRTPGAEPAEPADPDRVGRWNETWALAAAFGLASVPWTYGFVAGLDLPLWPSFVASASFFAAGGGVAGLVRGATGNLVGIVYAVGTLVVAGAVGGGPVALSLVVGAAMFLASLHAFVPWLSFAPATFFGYATLFGVHASGVGAFGLGGLAGETLAAAVAMLFGACVGLGTQSLARAVG